MQSNRQILKSERNNHLTFVAFQNQTERNVDLIWVDFEGNFHHYKTMEPQELIHVYTYVHHAFVFLDTINRDRMVVDGKVYHYVNPISMQYCILNNQIQRVVGAIRSPLRSLKTLAMNAVRDMLPDPEAAYHLDIPMSLKHELALAVEMKRKPIHQCTEYVHNE